MKLQNKFLIAMPNMDDPIFHRSVIYICEHSEQGSMGLVINRPTDLSLAELVAKFNLMMANNKLNYPSDYVLEGGPVHIERGFILHLDQGKTFQHSYKINKKIRLTTSADIIETMGTEDEPEKYLVALGCATWAPKQLEKEIANNDWLVVNANEDILFNLPYEQRWTAANQLLGIQPHNFAYQAGHS